MMNSSAVNESPNSIYGSSDFLNEHEMLNRITTRIRQSLELQDILDSTVDEVRTFLGTDRVKIYQFQPDHHGIVIAESLNSEHLPPLHGLNFPADDIPPYARELFLRARQRTIVDLDNHAIGISPLHTMTGEESDRAYEDIRYRAVDPCHLEYLKSMEVKSSVVVPIVLDGTVDTSYSLPSLPKNQYLWGLLVSHNASAREVSEQELTFIQAVVDQLELAITHSILLQYFREQAQQKNQINRIITALQTRTTLFNLQAALETTIDLFQGSGGRIYLPKPTSGSYDLQTDSPEQDSQNNQDSQKIEETCEDTPEESSQSTKLQTSVLQLDGKVLYLAGEQPDFLDESHTRIIEDNLLWQQFLASVQSAPTKLDTTMTTLETGPDIDSTMSPSQGPMASPHTWSVPWMRAIYALDDPSHVDTTHPLVWASSDIYREPLFRSLTPAFQNTSIRGLLIMPLDLGEEGVGCLTIFRNNVEQEIMWAGLCNPDKRQLAPRQSFEAWKQIKQNQVPKWTDADIRLSQAIAERFAITIQQRQLYARIWQLNQKLEEQIAARTTQLEQTTTMARQQEAITTILSKLQTASDIASIFRTATHVVRQLLDVERVAVYRFDEDWGGEFINSFGAVSSEWADTELFTRSEWNDSYLQETKGGHYQQHEMSVVDDIYAAELSECHIAVLELYKIRAFLISPLFVGKHLWGLLAVYQHSGPHTWNESTISFISQVAAHLGSALQQNQLLALAQKDAQKLPIMIEQQQTIAGVIGKIRESLDLTKIFTTTTQEVRRLLAADRVAIFQFYPDSGWDAGEFVSEDVDSAYPSALAAKVEDHCFGEQYAIHYQAGQIQAVADIYTKDLQPCHVGILSQFHVRANLIVPLIQKDHLWGLLCIHQCANARQWQPWEMEFAQQIATHLSVALQQTNLLQQAEAAKLAADMANKAKSEFLATMSHELRTPLNAILGLSEGLKEDVFGDLNEAQRKTITTIEQSGNHLLALITDILDLAKIESGNFSLELVPTALPELCNACLTFVQPLAKAKTIELEANITPYEPLIEVDPLRIRQLLINLLNNAVKFTPKKGKITLKAQVYEDSQTLEFQVKDTGIGIAPQDIDKVFDSFVQLDSRLNRQYGGTGLGLSLVKHLVDAHNGTIQVQSQLNEGSCFTVLLPYQSYAGRKSDASIIHDAQKSTVAALSSDKSAADEHPEDKSIIQKRIPENTQAIESKTIDNSAKEPALSRQPLPKSLLELPTQEVVTESPTTLPDSSVEQRSVQPTSLPSEPPSEVLTHHPPSPPVKPTMDQHPSEPLLNPIDSSGSNSTLPSTLTLWPTVDQPSFLPFQTDDLSPDFSLVPIPSTTPSPLTETTSVETASAETASVETASAETASVETASAETASVETASAETASTMDGTIHRPLSPENLVILLAEDNLSNVETFTNYLTHKKHQVIVAENGQEAIDLAQAYKPDIILMDIHMPTVDGLEAIQIIRTLPVLESVPIIALTALAMPGDKEQCLTAGANAYLSKPVRLKELTQLISTLVQPHQP